MLKPIWIPYNKWECYRNGMYENRSNDVKIFECVSVFKSKSLYQDMLDTLFEYENASKVKCTNKMFNPISWVGQATCNRLVNATKSETCKSWFMLNDVERKYANNCAKKAIEKYLEELENGRSTN